VRFNASAQVDPTVSTQLTIPLPCKDYHEKLATFITNGRH
jgi:hypothetical protein